MKNMTSTMTIRVKAILEVMIALFLLLWVFKVMESLKSEDLGNPNIAFGWAGYLVMCLIPLWKVFVEGRDFEKYGMTFRKIGFDIDIALSCFLPIFAINAALHAFDWRTWRGAFMVVIVQMAVLFIVLRVMKKKSKTHSDTDRNLKRNLTFLCAVIITAGFLQVLAGRAIDDSVSALIRFFAVAAPAEEIFFRGYVQTRLNDVFERKFNLNGVGFGWGLILSSVLFGVMHVLNPYNPLMGSSGVSLPWGLWTTVLGLILGLIREKTGKVIAPVILHAIINFF